MFCCSVLVILLYLFLTAFRCFQKDLLAISQKIGITQGCVLAAVDCHLACSHLGTNFNTSKTFLIYVVSGLEWILTMKHWTLPVFLSKMVGIFLTFTFISKAWWLKNRLTNKTDLRIYQIKLHDDWTIYRWCCFFYFHYPSCLAACCCHVLPPCHAAKSLANRHVLCILISRKWLRSWRERSDLVTLQMQNSFWYYMIPSCFACSCSVLKDKRVAQSHDNVKLHLCRFCRPIYFFIVMEIWY